MTRINKICRIISAILTLIMLITNICVPAFAIDYTTDESQDGISSELLEMMNNNPDEAYKVVIWLEDIDTETAVNEALAKIPDYENEMARLYSSPITNEEDAAKWEYFVSTKRNAMKACYSVYTASFSNAYLTENEVIYNSEYMPIVIAELSCERITDISEQSMIESIDYYNDEFSMETENEIYSRDITLPLEHFSIQDNISYIHADIFEDVWGTSGYGVNIGIFDVGIPDISYAGLSGANITVRDSSPVNDHATKVTEIAYKTAPDADFFCTTYAVYNRTTSSELDWLINNNVDVINISCGVLVDLREDTINFYGNAARLLDSYVHKYDVTIVNAAGNSGANTIRSGAMAYNVITVGNYYCPLGSVLDGASSYNNVENTEYAFKPDICAPGYVIFGDNTSDEGTSFAAPLITGVIALLMACRSSLRTNPTQVKAILTASVSLTGPHGMPINQSDYRKHGAGVVDASRANQILLSSDLYTSNIAPYASYQDYEVELFANQTTRISLAFEKVFSSNNAEYSLADLDLIILDSFGEELYDSTTDNNNVELVEFTPTAYDTYTIRVFQFAPAESSNSTGTTPYSIAWIQG